MVKRSRITNNEQKLGKGKAELIHAAHFARECDTLLSQDKIRRFEKLISLNQQTKVNSVHISLNFDPTDALSKEKLVQIAGKYMQGIGFDKQPYLVYQHHDAGHPHLHIVTTNIKSDGSRIPLHNIGRNASEIARREIEKAFNLVPAQKKQKAALSQTLRHAGKAQYGKDETRAAITAILNYVITGYHYTSFSEYNAVLRQYRVAADRGSQSSRIYRNGGLVYRILTEKGEKIGVPLKASSIAGKPTLHAIQARFLNNQGVKEGHKQRVKNAVDFSFARHRTPVLSAIEESLQRERIHLVVAPDGERKKAELIYVDHATRCAFTGSDLGSSYDGQGLWLRCRQRLPVTEQNQELQQGLTTESGTQHVSVAKEFLSLLHGLTKDESAFVPGELLEEKKKRIKKLKQ